jgi:hypothetical protein
MGPNGYPNHGIERYDRQARQGHAGHAGDGDQAAIDGNGSGGVEHGGLSKVLRACRCDGCSVQKSVAFENCLESHHRYS